MAAPSLIVFNPVSGSGRGRRTAERLQSSLESRGLEARLLETSLETDVFADVRPEEFASIVIVGGDGSFHEAINRLPLSSTPLAFCGTGTVNVLSREEGLPTCPEALADVLQGGRAVEIPHLEVNGRRGLLFAEAGFLGTIVARVNRWRRRSGKHGKLEFVLQAARVLPFSWGRPLRARIRTRDGTLERNYSNVLLTRARNYAGNMPMPIDAIGPPLRQGTFQLVGLRSRTPLGHGFTLALASLGLLPRLRGMLTRLGMIDTMEAVEVTVEGPAADCAHVDAESEFEEGPLSLPLHVGPSPGASRLLVPEERDARR